MSKKARGSLLLVLTAAIWGTAFVAQRMSVGHVGPFTFNAVRLFMAGFALLAAVGLSHRGPKKGAANRGDTVRVRGEETGRASLMGGMLCGVALFAASTLQQFGIERTTAGKAGFITALYIVIVPLAGLFWGRRAPKIIWLCVAAALAGLYLLSIDESFSIAPGDLLVALCALCFTAHILIIDRFSAQADILKMACVQFFVCAALSFIAMLVFEHPSVEGITAAIGPMAYCGLLSGGLGYTLQMFAQRDTAPAVASLIMSSEAVFAVLAGWLLLNESLSLREGVGCALMFAATAMAQLPAKEEKPQLGK